MLKHAIIYILGALITVLAGFALSVADQTEYANVLNHAGVSDQAFVYHTKSSVKVSTAVKQMQATKLDDYQVQFALSSRLSLFYAKGEYTSLPMKNGHFFSAADFNSSLPVAIVGTDQTATLYKAGEQSYLPRNNHYIPVIGVVGTRKTSKLNQHIFLNASSVRKTDNPKLRDVEILVDGLESTELAPLTRIFGAKPRQVSRATTQSHKSKWRLYGVSVLILLVAGLLMILVALITTLAMPHAQVRGLDAPLTNRYLWGLGNNFLPGVAAAIFVGAAISWWQFYMNNHFRLIIVSAFLLGIFVLATQVLMHLRLRKEH